jgi:hypothetical protein
LGEIVTDSALNIIKTDLNFHLNYSKKINNSINLQLNTNRTVRLIPHRYKLCGY